jgi:acid-sensing ion channel, other
MFIFSPFDLPLSIKQEPLLSGHSYQIVLEPKITKSDESLQSIAPATRKCYFEGERKLKFFKIYTQSNCELECESAQG